MCDGQSIDPSFSKELLVFLRNEVPVNRSVHLDTKIAYSSHYTQSAIFAISKLIDFAVEFSNPESEFPIFGEINVNNTLFRWQGVYLQDPKNPAAPSQGRISIVLSL